MKRYETIFIYVPDLSSDSQRELILRYKGIIESLKGIVIRVDEWGMRRLAYPIQKKEDGYYVLIDYAGLPEVVNELERNLGIDDMILRYQTVKLRDKISEEQAEQVKREIEEQARSVEKAAAAEAEKAVEEAAAETVMETPMEAAEETAVKSEETEQAVPGDETEAAAADDETKAAPVEDKSASESEEV